MFVLHLQITRVKIDQIKPTRPRLRLRAPTLLEFSSASKNQRGILNFFTKFRYAFRISANSDSVAAALNENHHKSEYSEYDRSKRRISVEALYGNRNTVAPAQRQLGAERCNRRIDSRKNSNNFRRSRFDNRPNSGRT